MINKGPTSDLTPTKSLGQDVVTHANRLLSKVNEVVMTWSYDGGRHDGACLSSFTQVMRNGI
jgi:hypothetical protein